MSTVTEKPTPIDSEASKLLDKVQASFIDLARLLNPNDEKGLAEFEADLNRIRAEKFDESGEAPKDDLEALLEALGVEKAEAASTDPERAKIIERLREAGAPQEILDAAAEADEVVMETHHTLDLSEQDMEAFREIAKVPKSIASLIAVGYKMRGAENQVTEAQVISALEKLAGWVKSALPA